MPHLVLEYTANLLPDFEPAQALHRMNTVLLASGEFIPDHIKSRAVRLDDFLVGDAAPGAFLHARLHLRAGRSAETKQDLAEGLVAALRSCVMSSPVLPVQITAESRDMDPAYAKAIIQN